MNIGQFRELASANRTGYVKLEDDQLSVGKERRFFKTVAQDPAHNQSVRKALFEALTCGMEKTDKFLSELSERLLGEHAHEVLQIDELKNFLSEYDGYIEAKYAFENALVLGSGEDEAKPADLGQIDLSAARIAAGIFKAGKIDTLLNSVQIEAIRREEFATMASTVERNLKQFYALTQGDLKDPNQQAKNLVDATREALLLLAEALRTVLNRSAVQPEGLMRLMSYCYARATEVQCVYDAAVAAEIAENDDVRVSDLMAEAAMSMHGADAFRAAVGARVTALVDRLRDLQQKKSSDLQGRTEAEALRRDIKALEDELKNVAQFGIRAGENMKEGVFRPEASLVEGYLHTVRSALSDLDQLLAQDYTKIARELVNDFFPQLDLASPDVRKATQEEIEAANENRQLLLRALSNGLDKLDPAVFDDLLQTVRRHPKSELFGLQRTTVHFAKNQLLAMKALARQEIKIEPSLLLKFTSGKVGLGTLLAAHAHGFGGEMVDERIDDRFLVEEKKLGEGGVNAVYRLTYQYPDGKTEVRVFKPETNARLGLQKLILGRSGYDETTRVAHLNAATSKAASLLGIPQVADKITVGTHNGKVGFFMREAPGLSPRKMGALRRRTPNSAQLGLLSSQQLKGLTGAQYCKRLAVLQKGLCELQWLDWLTGQMDRHSDNYLVDASEEGRFGVKAIDNDGSFSGYRVGMYKYRLTGFHLQHTLRVLKKKSVKDLLDAYPNFVSQDPSGCVIIDVENSPKLMRAVSVGLFGCNSASRPSVIPDVVYQKLMALDLVSQTDPQALRHAAKRLFAKDSATEEQIVATEMRLREMIAYAKTLKAREGELQQNGSTDKLVLADEDWEDQSINLLHRQKAKRREINRILVRDKGKLTMEEADDVRYFGEDYLFRDWGWILPRELLNPHP